ncbi:MAG: hypothetical protein ABS949_06875 [Solibacillus sp.]
MEQRKAIRPLLVMMAIIAVFSVYQFMDEPVPVNDEEKLAKTLEQIADVGQVTVYFHSNNNRESTLGAYFQQEEPQIVGVLIVAEGATTPSMVRLLQNSVSQILQMPKHRIVIVPMKTEEEHK